MYLLILRLFPLLKSQFRSSFLSSHLSGNWHTASPIESDVQISVFQTLKKTCFIHKNILRIKNLFNNFHRIIKVLIYVASKVRIFSLKIRNLAPQVRIGDLAPQVRTSFFLIFESGLKFSLNEFTANFNSSYRLI